MELAGKVAIITGATSGIGKAIAEKFAQEGAILVMNGRDQGKGEAINRKFHSDNVKSIFHSGDVGLRETNRTLVELALEKFGKVDIVVANAGMLGLGSVTDLREDRWKETLDVNLNSVFYLSRFAIPEMQRRGKGNLIVIASIAYTRSFPNHAAYCASKAGVVALTKQIALDYGPKIRANAICPGPVDTPFIWDSAVAFPDPSKAVQNAGERTPMKRLGEPVDIAELALFLASDRSSWVTGSAITIDGGATVS